jgi:hypothetical protein
MSSDDIIMQAYEKGLEAGYAEGVKRMGQTQLLLNILRPVLKGRSRTLRMAVGLAVGAGVMTYVLAPVEPKLPS